MTPEADSSSLNSLAASYIKACDDYMGVYRGLFEQFKGTAMPSGPLPLPSAFIDAWKSWAQGAGVQVGAPPFGGSAFPALGPSREHMEIAQKMAALGAQLQRSYAEFISHISGIQTEAIRTIQNPQGGASYEDWVTRAEAAYASLAHGETFVRLLAELCNTMSALKVERGKLLEYFSRQLNLPTRAEVDSLHQQIRELRERSHERSDS
jgi:hypothetical protein